MVDPQELECPGLMISVLSALGAKQCREELDHYDLPSGETWGPSRLTSPYWIETILERHEPPHSSGIRIDMVIDPGAWPPILVAYRGAAGVVARGMSHEMLEARLRALLAYLRTLKP